MDSLKDIWNKLKIFIDIIGLLSLLAFSATIISTFTSAVDKLNSVGVPDLISFLIVFTSIIFPLFIASKFYEKAGELKEDVKDYVEP